MKTIKTVIAQSNIPPRLIRGVVKQMGGMDSAKYSMRDIVNHGIGGGVHGFISCYDTCAFYKKFRNEINKLVFYNAQEFEESPAAFIKGFSCLDIQIQIESAAIYNCLLGNGPLDLKDDDTMLICNALAWFAGESVAREFCD